MHCSTPQHINVNAEQAADTMRGIPVTRIDKISLQHAHCNTLQHTATHCNALQRTATHCNALQRTATHCNALRHTNANVYQAADITRGIPVTRIDRISLQHAHCNTLQQCQAADITRGIPVIRIEAYAYSFLDTTGKLVCHDSLLCVS